MKRILFLLSFLAITVLSFAQDDTIHLKMKAWHYAFIYELKQGNNTPDEFIFVKQAAIKWNGTDSTQLITVVASFDLVERTFKFLAGLKEGIATMPNEDMCNMVMPQAARKPKLFAALLAIRDEHSKAKYEIIGNGLKRFLEIKQMWSY